MADFTGKTICILGRQPELGLAELESVYGSSHVISLGKAAMLDISAEGINFKNLGGVIKVAKILSVLPFTEWNELTDYLARSIPEYLVHVPGGKLTLGVSSHGLSVKTAQINRSLLGLKKELKKTKPIRVVPNKNPELSSAQVLHNKLTHIGGWELILYGDSNRTILAQTMFVQDIEAYAARDQARPKRDARVGMLPPKLAQIITNLAVGQLYKKADDKSRIRILDPFCGTGVILQEALLMGYSVLGSDVDERLVGYSETNLQWLVKNHPFIKGHVSIDKADAIDYKWPRFSTVASEIFLGRPLNNLPSEIELKKIISDTNTIASKFMRNLSSQLKTGQRICLAVPAWRKPDGQLVHLPMVAKLTDMGYNYVDFKNVRRSSLVYFREDQVVARELLVLQKK